MKKNLLTLVTLLCAIALYLAYQYSKTLTPETVMQQLFDMNAPARYAFVSDESAPKLAVIDMDSLQQTSLLDLKTTVCLPTATAAIPSPSATSQTTAKPSNTFLIPLPVCNMTLIAVGLLPLVTIA